MFLPIRISNLFFAIVLLFSFDRTIAQSVNKILNDFLEPLKGSVESQVSWYSGTKADSVKVFTGDILKIANMVWECNINAGTGKKDELDLNIAFRLNSGNAHSASVSVNFSFDDWNNENYLLIPAIVYNGNRYRAIGNGYNPGYPPDMYYNPKVPLTISNNPRLSVNTNEPSLIELQTVNASTPAVCFFSPGLKKGFILLTEQGSIFGSNGISFIENAGHTKASIKISAPSVRKKACGFGDFFDSGDKAADWKSDDEVSFKFKLFSFTAGSIPDLLKKFMEVRKSLSGENQPRNLFPMSKHLELATGICSNNWITVPAGSYYTPENNKDFQLGWVSGMMNTYPMLALNNEKERKRVLEELDFVTGKLQGRSGYFYGGITAEGKIRPEKSKAQSPAIYAMVRKNCDVLFWMIKHLMLLKEQGHGSEIKKEWEKSAKKLAEAFVANWKRYREFGQYIDPESGETAVFNSTAGAIAPAGLVLAYEYFGSKEFLEVAKESAIFYYERDVAGQGLTGGHCGDISQDADSESCFGFLESLMAVYYATRDEMWLERAKVQAALCATWTISYDVKFPISSQIGKLNSNMAGAIWASIQNKHAAPGICTASGDYLFKLYRATGNPLYADLIRDIQHAHAEAVDMPGHRTTNIGFGTSMERIQPSDSEGKSSIGNYIQTRNSWTETNGMLMDIELPGIYLRTDINRHYIFDHMNVDVIRNKREVILNITNPTPFDASVSVFAENNSSASRPLGYINFVRWPKVNVKAGETINYVVKK